ncbi:hypothetical protein K7432_014021 [Basidiobolus ranarum]|uniref:Carrier domain-containing protein n=1 Tax=Basidiobolus ranarum TaxID=34480 RepID=A0ABR2WIA4_9FUNG
MEEGSFDTIICNSVAQYFPNIEYLKDVVVRAVKLLRAGGHIFLGDIRSLVLLKHYHSSMELHKAHGDLRADVLEQRILDRMMSEKELMVDPAFFFALKEEIPEIGNVEILTKTGRSLNELTQYRYQVVIRVGTRDGSQVIEDWVDYQISGITLDEIKQTLESGQREYFAVENIANSRLTKEVALVKLLEMEESQALSVSSIRTQLEATIPSGVEVDDIYTIGKNAGYDVSISWSRQQNDGCFDVIFGKTGQETLSVYHFKEPHYNVWQWKLYGNNPLHEAVSKQFVPHLREYLRTVLPKFMIPSYIVILDTLPLMPNGKINRAALPAPSLSFVDEEADYVKPETDLEKSLGQIFAEVLGLERVSVHGNFFNLGGHSLLSIRLISKIRKILGASISLQNLFTAPTIYLLAKLIVERSLNLKNETDESPIVTLRDGGEKTPIVLVHAIGGGISYYQPLIECLDHSGPIYGIYASDFLGLMQHQTFTTVEDMTQYYAQSLLKASAAQKFIIGGWSYGGNIAFGVAVQLQKIGIDVPSVILFDSYPLFGPVNYEIYSAPLTRMITNLMNQMQESTEIFTEEIHIIRDMFGLGNSISRDDEVTLELLTNALNRISQMREYTPDHYSGIVCQIQSSQSKLQANPRQVVQRWEHFMRGKDITELVDGSHFSMMQSPYVETVANKLEQLIESINE